MTDALPPSSRRGQRPSIIDSTAVGRVQRRARTGSRGRPETGGRRPALGGTCTRIRSVLEALATLALQAIGLVLAQTRLVVGTISEAVNLDLRLVSPTDSFQRITTIAEATTPDPCAVVFRLDPVNVWAFKVLARTAIVPADGGDDPSFATNPSGTGPWRLFGWERDDRLVLRRFEDHSETERGHIDETELGLVQEWIEGWGAHPNASPSFQDLHKLVMNR